MNYKLMQPPFDVKPFDEMSLKEAKMHFEWYKSEIPHRLNQLRDAFAATGGSVREKLDLSPESLVPLWDWFLDHITLVPVSREEYESRCGATPDWMKPWIETTRLDTGTLALAMDIAIYFAEVFIKKFDGLSWGVLTKPKSLAYVNRPVLTGFRSITEMDPRNLIYNLTLKAARGESGPQALFDLYLTWLTYVPER